MRNVLLGSAGLMLSLGCMSGIYAQGTPATENAGLEEIVVTAEKRVTDLQKTPIAITAISGDELRARGEVQLNAALRNVPGLQIQSTAQGGTIYIRGIGSNGDSNEIDLAVSVTMDGAYSGRSESLAAGLYDVGQIEVLRGPQGTIYGRNSTAGAVTVSSANPEFDRFGVKVNGQVGNYSLYHLDTSLNVPVTDKFALRFAGMREKRNGYFSNNGRATDILSSRAKALYEPSEALRLLMTFDYSRTKGDDLTTVPITGTPTQPQWVTSDPWWVDGAHPANVVDFKFRTLTLQMDWDLGWSTLTAIPSYSNSQRLTYGDLITGTLPGGPGLNGQSFEEDQYTGEVRLASPKTSDIKWVTGLYYLRSNNGSEATRSGASTVTNAMGVNGVTYPLYRNDSSAAGPTLSKAAFGQVTYPVTDAFRLIAGARYTKDNKSRSVHLTSIAIPGYDSGVLTLDASFSQTTYRAGLEYDLAADSMLYTTVSTGYKAGGFYRGVPLLTYEPEDLISYELGSKSRFLNNTLQVNGAVYYYDYTNMQVSFTNPGQPYPIPASYLPAAVVNSTNAGGQVANADTGHVLGAEVEVDWLLTANDRINLTATASESEYGNFDPAKYTAELVMVSGEQMANAPDFTATPAYEHGWDLTGGRLTARAQSRYSEGYWTDTRGRDRAGAYQDSYWRSDAFLTYAAANSEWSVSGWVKNIEGKAQITQAFPSNRVFISDPRTYGLNFSASF